MATINDKIKDNNASFYYALLDFKDKHPDIIMRICGVNRLGLNDMTHAQILILANEMMVRALTVKESDSSNVVTAPGKQIYLQQLVDETTCQHMYSKAMNEPRPRKCVKCGHIEDLKRPRHGEKGFLGDCYMTPCLGCTSDCTYRT